MTIVKVISLKLDKETKEILDKQSNSSEYLRNAVKFYYQHTQDIMNHMTYDQLYALAQTIGLGPFKERTKEKYKELIRQELIR